MMVNLKIMNRKSLIGPLHFVLACVHKLHIQCIFLYTTPFFLTSPLFSVGPFFVLTVKLQLPEQYLERKRRDGILM